MFFVYSFTVVRDQHNHPCNRDTGDRRAAGIDFTVGVLDNSLVLVTTSAIGRSTDWWAFTYAFRYAV